MGQFYFFNFSPGLQKPARTISKQALLQAFAIYCPCLYTEAMESAEEKLVPPIGISDFNEIRTDNFYFVDKTCLIAKAFES